jgi:hypothetical protein
MQETRNKCQKLLIIPLMPQPVFDMPKSFQYHISIMEEIRLTEKVTAGG